MIDCTFLFEDQLSRDIEIRCELSSPPAKGWRVRTSPNEYWEVAEVELNSLCDTPRVYVLCRKASKSLVQEHFDQMP